MAYATDPRVNAYIAALPDWQQAICQEVRALVPATDPAVEETSNRSVVQAARKIDKTLSFGHCAARWPKIYVQKHNTLCAWNWYVIAPQPENGIDCWSTSLTTGQPTAQITELCRLCLSVAQDLGSLLRPLSKRNRRDRPSNR